MKTPENKLLDAVPHFRELEPVELWSAQLAFSVPYDEFEQAVIASATETGQGFTGFISRDDEGMVTSFTRTRYPRAKYGIPSIEDCHTGAAALAEKLGARLYIEEGRDRVRVVLGLLEGYDTDSLTHDADEVRQLLPNATVTAAEVFAARLSEDQVSIYTEPVAVIETNVDTLTPVYALADAFRQERFTVEDFEHGAAHVVETRHCTEPD